MKTGDVPASGKSAYGEKGMTAARRRQLRNMAEVAHGWDDLEQWECEEWRKKASGIRIRIRRKLTPQNVGKPRSRAGRVRRAKLR